MSVFWLVFLANSCRQPWRVSSHRRPAGDDQKLGWRNTWDQIINIQKIRWCNEKFSAEFRATGSLHAFLQVSGGVIGFPSEWDCLVKTKCEWFNGKRIKWIKVRFRARLKILYHGYKQVQNVTFTFVNACIGPLPSCSSPLFQSEGWGNIQLQYTIYVKICLICTWMKTSLHLKKCFSSRTHFEKEAKETFGNADLFFFRLQFILSDVL